ncbi:MAG: hypothetical protein ACREBD_35810 [Blastocatellia bacterium]
MIFPMRSAARLRRFAALTGLALAAFFVFATLVFFFGFARFIAYNRPSPLPAAAVS